MASPAYSILTQCVAQAKSQLDLAGVGSAAGIPDANVYGLNVPYSREQRQRLSFASRPALIFSVVRNAALPVEAGDNGRYVAYYTVLAQILHSQHELRLNEITESILQWEYRIHNYFHMGNLRQSADLENTWYITLSPVQQVDLTDERLFHIWDDAVAVIPITFKSTEFHNTEGRT